MDPVAGEGKGGAGWERRVSRNRARSVQFGKLYRMGIISPKTNILSRIFVLIMTKRGVTTAATLHSSEETQIRARA